MCLLWGSSDERDQNPKADERDVALDMFDHDPTLFNGRSVQTIVADKG